ncbi:MAG: Ppx/GppA family phosphatase [Chloroflexi bacterium]|nr:Ppx/GppA family phosphatase [Chloroflexota bacterium]
MLGDARTPLRLVHALGPNRQLTASHLERTVAALRGFRAVAHGRAVDRIIAVATAAIREASNGQQFLDAVERDSGVRVRLVDGQQEAHFGFMGAVHGVPIEHGLVLDIGGGSVQLTRFRDRGALGSWSLPLGALRLSDRFLVGDPPARSELERLRRHVRQTVAAAGVPPLDVDGALVGTGGTIRNLARIDRKTRSYPIPRLHAYTLQGTRLRDIVTRLAGLSQQDRAGVPGLNADRTDSIVGGALVAQTLMDRVGATQLIVSGHGLREGLALDALVGRVPTTAEVRVASVLTLASRFTTFDEERASRRRSLADDLLAMLEPGASAEARATLVLATTLLDVGRSVDYYNRHDHAAQIVQAADLDGFWHRSIALAALTMQLAANGGDPRAFEPLLQANDQPALNRLAAILAFVDALEQLIPPGARGTVEWRRKGDNLAAAAAILDTWPLRDVERRLESAYGLRLDLQRACAATRT